MPTPEAPRILRRRQTSAEAVLWQALRRNALDGLHIRRQHRIGPYVVDFCCVSARLVVEVDGRVHADPDRRALDAYRDAFLREHGYRVLRFSNTAVLHRLPETLARIQAAVAGEAIPSALPRALPPAAAAERAASC